MEPVGTQGVRADGGHACAQHGVACKTRPVWDKWPPNDALKDYPTLIGIQISRIQ